MEGCLQTCETEWGALPALARTLRASWICYRGWLATGGRDKMVKVWDMTTHRAKEVHCVQTIASVARVKWRPECRHHLATCSMMVDHNIYVWDVRRPFVPAAMFEEHRDVTTGIAWRHPHDPSFLLSGSKDSTLCQHLFRDASQPVERANPEGLCYGLFGDLAFAAKESLVSAESGRKPCAGDRRHPIFFKRKLDPAEPFVGLASSALSVFEMEPSSGSMSWFVDTAERYALAGRPLAELCDHNAKVARELGRNQVGGAVQGPWPWGCPHLVYSDPTLVSALSSGGGHHQPPPLVTEGTLCPEVGQMPVPPLGCRPGVLWCPSPLSWLTLLLDFPKCLTPQGTTLLLTVFLSPRAHSLFAASNF